VAPPSPYLTYSMMGIVYQIHGALEYRLAARALRPLHEGFGLAVFLCLGLHAA
jgi:hypothetical protein